MTQIDYYPILVEAFGPQCPEKSHRPDALCFCDGAIWGNRLTGRYTAIVEVDGQCIRVNNLRPEDVIKKKKKNGSASGYEIVEEAITRIVRQKT